MTFKKIIAKQLYFKVLCILWLEIIYWYINYFLNG